MNGVDGAILDSVERLGVPSLIIVLVTLCLRVELA